MGICYEENPLSTESLAQSVIPTKSKEEEEEEESLKISFPNVRQMAEDLGISLLPESISQKEISQKDEEKISETKNEVSIKDSSDNDPPHFHAMSYRDVVDVAVRWRQISEPLDTVWWIDCMPPIAFSEGFGLQTPMVNGHMKTVRYYSYHKAAIILFSKLMLDQIFPMLEQEAASNRSGSGGGVGSRRGYSIGRMNQRSLDEIKNDKQRIIDALEEHENSQKEEEEEEENPLFNSSRLDQDQFSLSLEDLHEIMGRDFFVITPCESSLFSSHHCPFVICNL